MSKSNLLSQYYYCETGMNSCLPLFHNYTYQAKPIKLYLSGRCCLCLPTYIINYIIYALLIMCTYQIYMSTSVLPTCTTIYTFQAGVLMIYLQLKQLYLHLSRDMRFPTMWYVRPAKPQISLRIRAV